MKTAVIKNKNAVDININVVVAREVEYNVFAVNVFTALGNIEVMLKGETVVVNGFFVVIVCCSLFVVKGEEN